MTVRWPDGQVQSFSDVPANSTVDLTYGGQAAIAQLADPNVEARRAPRAVSSAGLRHVIMAVAGVLSAVAFAALLGLTLARPEPPAPLAEPSPSASPEPVAIRGSPHP